MLRTLEEVEKAVSRGAAYLDKQHPGWREQIDVEKLEIACCRYCILGQLHGDFFESPELKDLGDYTRSSEYGFAALRGPYAEMSLEETMLEAAWKRELAR